jgi:hypothetical protein
MPCSYSSIHPRCASWPRLRCERVRRAGRGPGGRLLAAALCAIALLGSACERERIEVRDLAASHSYGQEQLLAAVDRFAQSQRTPADYRAMAAEVERLTPQFNAVVAGEASRNLAFLALEPLDAHFDAPPARQLEVLGLTVWPTAFGEPPAPGEDAWAYSERLCAGPLSEQCKQIVPEHRALILSQLVWRHFKERARSTLHECEECESEPRYPAALTRFEQREGELSARAGEITRRAHPKHWPIAGEHASPWSLPPVVTVRDDGTARLEATPESGLEPRELPAGGWDKALAEVRNGGETLGVWIGPGGDLGRLRLLGEAARTAGYRQLAIQARAPQFPYELREYRVALARRSTVALRDRDSVQLLLSALDSGLASGQAMPAL